MQAIMFVLLRLFHVSWWHEPNNFTSKSPIWILEKWRFYRLLSEDDHLKFGWKGMKNDVWRWVLGLIYIIAVATIWIAASFVVQSVVEAGVSPFLITYICNSLFIVYIPLVEIGRYLEDEYETLLFWKKWQHNKFLQDSEEAILLGDSDDNSYTNVIIEHEDSVNESIGLTTNVPSPHRVLEFSEGLDAKGRWTRTRVAKVSLLICPFWFLAQLTFNLSLKYTTVTSNTILSSSSSLFTFLVSLAFLGEKFTWVKLVSVLLCMGGTIIVSMSDCETGLRVSAANSVLGDSETAFRRSASNPVLGDVFAIVSSAFYAVYITLIRKKLLDNNNETGKSGKASMAQFLGFLGLFNLGIFLPFALVLNFAKLEPFDGLTSEQFGLIVGKGLLDNVLSDYLWAKAILLTTTTVATAGLTIQVPLAAIVDSITGKAPHLMDYVGAVAVMLGFAGINIPSDAFTTSKTEEPELELENGNLTSQSNR